MPGLDDAGLARLDALVSRAVAEGQVPGAVVGVAAGDEVHVTTAGAMSIDGPPMARDTLFRITSVTKPMTAATVLTLVADGLIGLDDDIEGWLPELADRRVLAHADGPLIETVAAHRPITVRDLLTFTWGFGMQGALLTADPAWPIAEAARERELHTFSAPSPAGTPDPDTWLGRLGELPLIAQPGETWLYQTGSAVLGVLAARLGAAGYDEVMRRRLLDPLGMTDTTFWTSDTARLATAYTVRDAEFVAVDGADGQWSRPPAFCDGGGGLLSTVDDVLRFARMLLRDGADVLPGRLVEQMTSNQLTPEQAVNPWAGLDLLDGRGWGFGLSVLEDRHGWDGGSGCAWSNVPALDLTVVTLTQRDWAEGPPAVCDGVLTAAREAVRT